LRTRNRPAPALAIGQAARAALASALVLICSLAGIPLGLENPETGRIDDAEVAGDGGVAKYAELAGTDPARIFP
jgi:hypothetical protein